MIVMKEMGMSEVLTNDKHFAQEGFTILFSEPNSGISKESH